jgi:hypothetical protein
MLLVTSATQRVRDCFCEPPSGDGARIPNRVGHNFIIILIYKYTFTIVFEKKNTNNIFFFEPGLGLSKCPPCLCGSHWSPLLNPHKSLRFQLYTCTGGSMSWVGFIELQSDTDLNSKRGAKKIIYVRLLWTLFNFKNIISFWLHRLRFFFFNLQKVLAMSNNLERYPGLKAELSMRQPLCILGDWRNGLNFLSHPFFFLFFLKILRPFHFSPWFWDILGFTSYSGSVEPTCSRKL